MPIDNPIAQKIHPIAFDGCRVATTAPTVEKTRNTMGKVRSAELPRPPAGTAVCLFRNSKTNDPATRVRVRPHVDHARRAAVRVLTARLSSDPGTWGRRRAFEKLERGARWRWCWHHAR